MADVSADAHRAVANSPMAEALLPPMAEAINSIVDAEVQNGFTVTSDGAIHVNLVTEMPGVTPAMIDWWFGWHSDSPERYKLWHPRAHVHAQWASPPPSGSTGRARYVGYTSEVDEYLGSTMIRGAIQFRRPEELGLVDAAVAAGVDATAVCARTGLVDLQAPPLLQPTTEPATPRPWDYRAVAESEMEPTSTSGESSTPASRNEMPPPADARCFPPVPRCLSAARRRKPRRPVNHAQDRCAAPQSAHGSDSGPAAPPDYPD